MENKTQPLHRTSEHSGIFALERVRYFCQQCSVLMFKCFGQLYDYGVQISKVDPRLNIEEAYLDGIDAIADWPHDIIQTEKEMAIKNYPDIERNFLFTFASYVRNYFGKDEYGRSIPLEIRTPPIAYFLHELYRVGSEYKEVRDGSILGDKLRENKLCKIILRDTLRRCSRGRVSMTQNRPEDSIKTVNITTNTPSNLVQDAAAVIMPSGRGDGGNTSSSDSSDSDSENDRRPSSHNHHDHRREGRSSSNYRESTGTGSGGGGHGEAFVVRKTSSSMLSQSRDRHY